MSTSQGKTEIDQLRRLASAGDTAGFAARLLPLLGDQFAYWFQEVKTQKLLSRFRNKGHIKTTRGLLLGAQGREHQFSEEQIQALAHHFDVCKFFQDLYDHIDAETAGLPCRVAHQEVFLRAVIRVLEIANYGFQRNVITSFITEQEITALQLSQRARQFRDLLDAGNIILNSNIARNGKQRDYKIGEGEIVKLFELAYQYDEVSQIFDTYAYQEVEIRLNRRSLIVKKNSRDAELASAVGSERTSDYDHARNALLSTMEADAQRECNKVEIHSPIKFIQFLSHLGQAAEERCRDYLRALRADLEYEVGGYFDLATCVSTKSGTFTVAELIGAWAVISSIAMLGQRWSDRLAVVINSGQGPRDADRRRIVLDVPVPELALNWVARILSKEANVSRGQARALIHQFSSEPAVGRIDLFYKPLVPISETILFPTAYIRSSRFDRNIFALIATESDLDQKRKGYLPVLSLKKDFVKAGFRALTDFTVRVNRQELTDLDIAAFKDDTLFLAQSKIVIEPDTTYDNWKVEQKLSRAAAQLQSCLEHLDAVREGLFERLGMKGTRERRVVPFICTNSRMFTERRFGGFPVVDLAYLRFVLSGARGAIIVTGSPRIGIGSGKAYIKGKYPTAQELGELLCHTVHAVMRRELAERYEMKKIGNWKIHVPMVGLKTPGEARIVVTDKEIPRKDQM